MHKKIIMLAATALIALPAVGCAELEEPTSGESAKSGNKSSKSGRSVTRCATPEPRTR